MRRALAAAILGISLWIGSLAWSGFIMTRTVLDPSRSESVADALYDNPAVQEQLVENIADAIERAVGDRAQVPRPLIENAAAQALQSPAVKAVVVDAFVATHQAFLGEGEVPESIDLGAFGSEVRRALVEARPSLDATLPAAPALSVELPTDRVPNLGPVRRGLETAVPALAAGAAAGALLALGVTSNRPAILRRAGIWAVALSLGVLAFAYGIPWLGERFAPDQSQIIAALIGALAATTRAPAVTLAAAGGAGIVASFIWKFAPSPLDVAGGLLGGGDAAQTPSSPSAPPSAYVPPVRQPRRDIPQPMHRRTGSDPTAVAPDSGRPVRRPDPDGYSRRSTPPPPDPHPGYPTSPPKPGPTAGNPTRPKPATAAPTRWVDGVGWVLESTDNLPENARWVPGVGYVVDS